MIGTPALLSPDKPFCVRTWFQCIVIWQWWSCHFGLWIMCGLFLMETAKWQNALLTLRRQFVFAYYLALGLGFVFWSVQTHIVKFYGDHFCRTFWPRPPSFWSIFLRVFQKKVKIMVIRDSERVNLFHKNVYLNLFYKTSEHVLYLRCKEHTVFHADMLQESSQGRKLWPPLKKNSDQIWLNADTRIFFFGPFYQNPLTEPHHFFWCRTV